MLLLFITSLVSLILPIVLFSNAFLSPNEVFKDLVNTQVEAFYSIFFLMSCVLATVVTKYCDTKKITSNIKLNCNYILKIVIILYALFLILNATSRFVTYKSEGIDVTFFKQELTQISNLEIPKYAWSQHFSPILFLLAPLYSVTQSGAVLMFLQAVAVVSGIIPLYLVIKKNCNSETLALAICLAYLTFGGLQYGYAYGFHEILFFPPLFFWLYFFYTQKYKKMYISFLLLCLSVKEEVSFILIFWGLYLLYKKKYWYAWWAIGLGIIWYILCFQIIFPAFNEGGYGYWGQYPAGNSGILGLVSFVLFHPKNFLQTIFTPIHKIHTLFHSFGIVTFLPFVYPPSLLLVIPSIMQKLLSDNLAAHNGLHYSATTAAVVFVALIESIPSIKHHLSKYFKKTYFFLSVLIMYMALLTNILYGYHPLSPMLFGREQGLSEQQQIILNRAIKMIPADKNVAAQYYIRSHLNKPYWLTSDGPKENESADYIIVNTELPLVMAEAEYMQKNVDAIITSGNYEVLVNQQGTLLFKKKAD